MKYAVLLDIQETLRNAYSRESTSYVGGCYIDEDLYLDLHDCLKELIDNYKTPDS